MRITWCHYLSTINNITSRMNLFSCGRKFHVGMRYEILHSSFHVKNENNYLKSNLVSIHIS